MMEKSYALRCRLPTQWAYFTSKLSANLLEAEALEAIDVEAEPVWKYTASTYLVDTR